MFRKVLFLTFCAALAVTESIENEFEKCGEDFKCAEDKLISLVDEYSSEQSLSLVGDIVTVERTGNDVSTPNEGLYERVAKYLSCHELRFNFPTNTRVGKSLMEETRSSKLKKIMLPLLLLLKLKAVILIPIVLSVISLVAFKGLGAGLIALVLSGATAFKSVLEGHQSAKKVSFEVIPPHWSRAGYASAPGAVLQEFYPYQTIPQ